MNGGHVKLGIFVVVATALLIVVLLLLGVLDRLKPSVTIETYFDDSIQTLVVGAPVRYRGVRVGRVSRIGFAQLDYPQPADDHERVMGTTILVEAQIGERVLRENHLSDFEKLLPGLVKKGLRLRLASTGLGGPTFIELVYLDPVEFPALQVPWAPDDAYIPAASSVTSTILDALAKILMRVSDDQMLSNLAQFVEAGADLEDILSGLEDNGTAKRLVGSLEELADAGKSLSDMLEGDRLSGLVDEASSLLRSARQMLEDEGPGGLRPLIASLSSMADVLEQAGTALDGLAEQIDRSGVIEDLESLGASLGPAGRDLSDLAARLDVLVSANESDVSELIKALRRASAQLQGLLEDAEQNPSRLIFGDPPPRRTPGESR